jgi:hypothetical protein
MATWWAVQEGLLGDLTNTTVTGGTTRQIDVHWHVVSGSNKPNATAHGPYPTQATAQAEADTLNGGGPNSDAPSVAKQGAEKAASGVGNAALAAFFNPGPDGSSPLLRVAEILLGVVLMAVGLSHITGTENTISDVAKRGGKAAMFAAAA